MLVVNIKKKLKITYNGSIKIQKLYISNLINSIASTVELRPNESYLSQGFRDRAADEISVLVLSNPTPILKVIRLAPAIIGVTYGTLVIDFEPYMELWSDGNRDVNDIIRTVNNNVRFANLESEYALSDTKKSLNRTSDWSLPNSIIDRSQKNRQENLKIMNDFSKRYPDSK